MWAAMKDEPAAHPAVFRSHLAVAYLANALPGNRPASTRGPISRFAFWLLVNCDRRNGPFRRILVVQAPMATVMCVRGAVLEPPAICRREP